MTLVEVVAGMTLLASLATGMLLAFGAHQKQLRRAEHRIDAIAIADQLLGQWYSGQQNIPRNRWGRVVANQERWVWTTRTIELATVGAMPVERIRVEIHRERDRQDRQPSAVVELFAPLETPPQDSRLGI